MKAVDPHIKRLQELCDQAQQFCDSAEQLCRSLTRQIEASRAAMAVPASRPLRYSPNAATRRVRGPSVPAFHRQSAFHRQRPHTDVPRFELDLRHDGVEFLHQARMVFVFW